MFKALLLLGFLFLAACQTAAQKNMALLNDRAEKLRPLSEWRSSWCRVEVEMTQPALARFKEMFPDENLATESWAYNWKARENMCEVTPVDVSPATKSQQGFLNTAFCLLLQVHYVNSPFDELKIEPRDIESVKDVVHIASGADKDLGIYLPRERFVVETRTRSRGQLIAEYSENGGHWLPSRLEQRRGNTIFVVEDMQYAGARPWLESFWIAVGGEKALRQSQVKIKDCRDL